MVLPCLLNPSTTIPITKMTMASNNNSNNSARQFYELVVRMREAQMRRDSFYIPKNQRAAAELEKQVDAVIRKTQRILDQQKDSQATLNFDS